MKDEEEPKFAALVDFLKRSRGFDFTGYKPASLMRRVRKRMQAVEIADFADYVDYLEVHPDEFTQLFNTVLINVTAFFRDEEAWDYLAKQVIPRILARKQPADPIRVWSAGCSSGQEAYTVAMVLAEELGLDAFRQRVKIYASDVDEGALAQARQASYSDHEMETVPEPLRAKYFAPTDHRHVFRSDLRRSIIFGRIDLVRDAPISRLDLLICRNTLMYFNAEAQHEILRRLHFALNDHGFLFLGRAEMLLTHANLFKPIELRHRVFAKTALPNPPVAPLPGDREEAHQRVAGAQWRNPLGEVSFDAGPVPQVVVDAEGDVAMLNSGARVLFGLSVQDLGRPLRDLTISYRPLEVRALIERAYAERRTVEVNHVERASPEGETQWLDVRVTPLYGEGGLCLGASITYHDTSRFWRQQEEIRQTTRELEAVYQALQTAHEELETTNEELQSTNEELETTNEELHSSNEELETTNEELQSTNQELDTINQELNQRSGELQQLNTLLEAVFGSLTVAVVAVDHHLTVLAWSRRAEDLWGFRSAEATGQSLLALDIGLPVEKLPLPAFLTGEAAVEEGELEGTDRRGRPVCYHVTLTRFADPAGVNRGVVLLTEDVTERKEADRALEEALAYAQGIVETVPEPLLVLDGNLRVRSANEAFYRAFQVTKTNTEGQLVYDLGNGEWDIPALRELLQDVLSKEQSFHDFKVDLALPGMGQRQLRLNGRQVQRDNRPSQLILLAIEDVAGRPPATS